MTLSTLVRTIVGFVAAIALASTLAPALASADTSYYYGNCGYPYSFQYNQYPTNWNNTYPANCGRGNLLVYVQVNAPANSYYSHPVSDFSVSVNGGNAWPATVQGATNGQPVSVLGSYSVTAAPFNGFSATYSTGCTGTLSQGQQAVCIVTENPVYPSGYSPYPYFYQQFPNNNGPVVISTQYVPKLPNTGFEPQNVVALIVLSILLAMASLTLPYVRKAFAAILG